MQITKEVLKSVVDDLNRFSGTKFNYNSKTTVSDFTEGIEQLSQVLEDKNEIAQLSFDVLTELEMDIPAGIKIINEKKSKKKGKKEKNPGVIATIFEIICQAKTPITREQILSKLSKKFPERNPESMIKTIRVQLPFRMSTEKKVSIIQTEQGFILESLLGDIK